MKKTIIPLMMAAASVVLCGCYTRDVDLTLEADGQQMHIFRFNNRNVQFASPDTLYLPYGTMVEAVSHLLAGEDMVVSYNRHKQRILPDYHFAVYPYQGDHTPIVHEMVRQHLVRIDTSYLPVRLLTVADPELARPVPDSLGEYASGSILAYVAATLRSHAGLPVLLDDALDPNRLCSLSGCYATDTTAALDLLADCGLALVPDPQGRQMPVLTVNRCKGKY